MQRVFRALSDPSRRRVLALLRGGELSAGEIASHFELSKPTLSRHLSVLREADLVRVERRGTHMIYQLNASVAEEALGSLLHSLGIGIGGQPHD